MPNAILFDLDGLLIDSEPHWRAAQREVLGARGVPLSDTDLDTTQGLRIDAVVDRYAEPRGWTPSERRRAVSDIVDAVEHHIRHHGQPMPGVEQVMTLTAARRRGIASSSPLRLIDAAIEALDLPIEVRVSAELVAAGKPDPAVYYLGAEAIGASPEQCTAFEDSVHGVQAAIAAGMRCVAVPSQTDAVGYDLATVIRQSLFAVVADDLDG